MGTYAQEISELWNKFNIYYSKVERQEFENIRRSYEAFNSQSLCLDFDSDLFLAYQNIPVPEHLKKYINAGNFLYIPTTRSHLVVLGGNVEFLTKISEYLEEAEKSPKQIIVQEKNFYDLKFQLLIKKGERKPNSKKNKNIRNFTLVFHNDQQQNNEESTAQDTSFADLALEKKGSSVIRASVKKVIKINKLTRGSFGLSKGAANKELTPVPLDELRTTIIAEYLPDQSTGLEHQVTPSRQWVKKFSGFTFNEEKIEEKNLPNKKKGKVFRVATENPAQNKSEVDKQPALREYGDHTTKFDPNALRIYEDDEKKLSNWSLDVPSIISDLEKSRLVWFMLEDFGLVSGFNIEKETLCEFILQIQAGYSQHKNPFHNYTHGVTVMHACYYMLKYCGFREGFSDLMNLGILIAAFCHDVGHRGKTNIFEVHTRSELAITYHDRAVLEQYHAAYTFRILNKEPFNIFASLSPENYRDIRKILIICILATDMKEHFEELKNLKLLTEGLKQMAGINSPHRAKGISKPGEQKKDILEWSEDDIKLITGIIVHSADLSGPTKSWELEYYLAGQVNKEFIKQSEDEKALGLPVTPYMLNLDKPAVMAKAEVQFIKFVVKPLWDAFLDFTGGAVKVATENLDNNLIKWEEMYNKAIETEEAQKAKEAEKIRKAQEDEEKTKNT